MATYVYACKNKDHPRKEVQHPMKESPAVKCAVCKKPMHKVMQPFRLGFNATEVLLDWMDNNYRIMRGYPKDWRRRLFSPDLVKRPLSPIPGTQSDYRKVKPNAKQKSS